MNGEYQQAIFAIFLAALFDGLDGRVARAIGAQSPFGEQFDSLSDLLAFGVAPAILMYSWSLNDLGRIGLAACFVYTACAAFRLARFNVQIGVVDKRYFIGVESVHFGSLVSCGVCLVDATCGLVFHTRRNGDRRWVVGVFKPLVCAQTVAVGVLVFYVLPCRGLLVLVTAQAEDGDVGSCV